MCDPKTKIISFFENAPVGFGYSADFLFLEDLPVKTLLESTNTFLLKNDSIFINKGLDHAQKDFYRAQIVLDNSTKDTLDLLIFVDFILKDYKSVKGDLELVSNSVGTYTSEMIEPTFKKTKYENSTYYGSLDISSFIREIFNDNFLIVEDVNNDNVKDLVLSQTRINHQGLNLNVHQISIPLYLIREGDRFTVKRNSFNNNTIFHAPTILNKIDIDKDGRNEIINYGEHYHALTATNHNFYLFNRSYLRYLGLDLRVDYNENDFKLPYYYKWVNNELTDKASNYIYKDATEPAFLSSYSNAVGDINNDGFTDYILTSATNGNNKYNYVLDVMTNNKAGGFIVNRKELINYYGSEGEGIIIDVNGDGFRDLIIGGGITSSRDSSAIAVFYNDQNGHFNQNYEVFDKMNKGLGLRNAYESDLDQDGKNEVIAFFSTGYGADGGGLTLAEIPNLVKVYKIISGELIDASNLFFQSRENEMNFYTQTAFVKFIDLDGDGHKDLVPRFGMAEPEFGWPSGNGFRGLWNNSRGFQYFKFDSAAKKFKVVNLGPIKTNAPNNSSPYLYNYFDFVNFDSEQYLNWITLDKGNLIKITPNYILPLTKEIELKINQIQESTSLSWTAEPNARDYNLKLFDADRILLDTTLKTTNFELINYKNYPTVFKAKVKSQNVLNSGTWSKDVEIKDVLPPLLKAVEKLTVILGPDGKGLITIGMVDLGTKDNHKLTELSLSKTNFTCADLGTSKVTFTAKDASGNASSAEVTITVVDEIKPTLKAKAAYTIKLDGEGKAALKWEDLDEGSSDNCSIKDKLLSKTSFTCADLGTSKVTFTAKDASGNTSTAEVTVTVVDEIKPTLKAKAAYTIKLDAEGKAALKWEDLDEGSSDNCSIKDKLLSKTSFTCADLGTSKITFTAKDASGNTSAAEVTVTVVDEIKPTAKVKSGFVIKLDVQGKATLKWEDIDDSSTDNCSIKERKLSKTDFTRTDGGDNKVTYTITDANGNTSSIETTVRVDIVLSAPERANQGSSIKAYPNPVNDYLYLEFADGINTSGIRGSSLVDASGRVLGEIQLEEGAAGQLGFSTRDLKQGMYFLRLSTRDTLHLIKFTVIH